MAKKRKTKKEIQRTNEIITYIIALISIALIIVAVFQLGYAGKLLDKSIKNIFGNIPYYFIMSQLFGFCVYMIVQGKILSIKSRFIVGSLFFTIGLMLLFGCIDAKGIGFDAIVIKNISSTNLGVIQLLFYAVFSKFFGLQGTGLFAIVFIIIGVVIYFMISLSSFLKNRHKELQKTSQQLKQKRVDNQVRKEEKIKNKPKVKLPPTESTNHQSKIFDLFNDEELADEFDKQPDEIINEPEMIDVIDEIPFDDSDVDFEQPLNNEKAAVEEEIFIEKNIESKAKDYKLPSFDLLSNPKTSDANQVNRKKGFGKEIFYQLNRLAKENNNGRVEWHCLDWSKDSMSFYENVIGAEPQREWIKFCLDEQAIDSFSKSK